MANSELLVYTGLKYLTKILLKMEKNG
jgi:hypothetical protein